jgi:hypothetical protein
MNTGEIRAILAGEEMTGNAHWWMVKILLADIDQLQRDLADARDNLDRIAAAMKNALAVGQITGCSKHDCKRALYPNSK